MDFKRIRSVCYSRLPDQTSLVAGTPAGFADLARRKAFTGDSDRAESSDFSDLQRRDLSRCDAVSRFVGQMLRSGKPRNSNRRLRWFLIKPRLQIHGKTFKTWDVRSADVGTGLGLDNQGTILFPQSGPSNAPPRTYENASTRPSPDDCAGNAADVGRSNR